MFESRTYKALMDEVLAAAPVGIDTRQGSIYFDAMSGFANILARFYADLDTVSALLFVGTASGEWLERKAYEFGLSRAAAQPVSFEYSYTGASPEAGDRFFHPGTGLYFVLAEDETAGLHLVAETPGSAANIIRSGDLAVPVNTIPGLTASEFGAQLRLGTDDETDDSLRQRIIDKITGPAANGNRAHYKSWAEANERVGRARIYPLWNGENTVKAVLVSPDGLPVDDTTVAEVQEYIDPARQGLTAQVGGKTYVVGDGIGDGVANIGAHVTVTKADALSISVAFAAELETGADPADVEAAAEAAIAAYIRSIIMDTADDLPLVVRVNAVGAIISRLDAVVDYSNLTINGGTTNLTATDDQVPVLSGVTLNVP